MQARLPLLLKKLINTTLTESQYLFKKQYNILISRWKSMQAHHIGIIAATKVANIAQMIQMLLRLPQMTAQSI